ncbi:MAG: quinol dehydrogenase periplasmic component [Candidatus Accumulibacter appositus]|uniref:Quinol dehydrogenase periplasmic component n=1 Tax=Candidatus Accumulibacter appositus TaxID=1454003 RepID=A0A011PY57_9PROT|nr:ferredoxin-type protein NapG [Accumulibacter sp.]EXI81805.1 MAG: quinol dehydrogenase periplasmic component [Candidatus Accumulibacter appositus]HRF04181.1 ferredoxin-type protein NapG [Accumulibacter sp.]
MPTANKKSSPQPPRAANTQSLTRRQFVFDSARLCCGIGIFGLALATYTKQAKAKPPLAVRPPGAGAEDDFLGACIRCGMCVRDCPYHILELARPESPIATGTPYFTARSGPCEMCEDIPCVKACPTGALDHGLTDINQSRMGLAVLSDQETCLNFLGLRCDVCYRVCPVIDKAITLEVRPNTRTGRHAMFIPTVHSEHCTGCGKCESACVTEEASIRVLPAKLVKGSLGEHYRLGWDEKSKAGGHSLVEDRGIVDLPDRMPDGMHLEGHFDPGSDKLPARKPASSPALPSLPPGLGGPAAPGSGVNALPAEAPR